MPSSPICRARAIFVMSPRCPRFQSVIPTRIGGALSPRALIGVQAGRAAAATAARFTKSRRFNSIDVPVRLVQPGAGSPAPPMMSLAPAPGCIQSVCRDGPVESDPPDPLVPGQNHVDQALIIAAEVMPIAYRHRRVVLTLELRQ